MEALQEIFATDPITLCKSIPDIAHLANENSFCNKLLEIQRDFSKISKYETRCDFVTDIEPIFPIPLLFPSHSSLIFLVTCKQMKRLCNLSVWLCNINK
jgi:hypothetical protein